MAERDAPLEFVITRAFFALRGYQGSGESLRKAADKQAANSTAANPKGYRVTPETVVTLPDRCEVRVDTSKTIDVAEKLEGQLVTELRAREISKHLQKKSKGEDLDI